jgi:hypothetical protein
MQCQHPSSTDPKLEGCPYCAAKDPNGCGHQRWGSMFGRSSDLGLRSEKYLKEIFFFSFFRIPELNNSLMSLAEAVSETGHLEF